MKSQYIKKESIAYDESFFEENPTHQKEKSQQALGFQHRSPSSSSKRQRQQETMFLRSPPPTLRKQKADSRLSHQYTQGVNFIHI